MYTLYGHPMSQHSRRCVALFEAAELPYELKVVALDKGQQMQPEFLAMNPHHQVPVLVDGDFVLYESNAIMRYLCVKHSLDAWYPTAADERGRLEQWLDWTQTKFGPQVGGLVFNKVFAGPKADQAAITRAEAQLPGLFEILHACLGDRSYLLGDRPGIADLAVASQLTQLGYAHASPTQPALQAYEQRMRAVPGFARALANSGL